jgi:hypothetical protein
LYGPVEHNVLITAVTQLQEAGLVEKTNQWRSNAVIVLGRMVIDLKHQPGAQIVVIRPY